MARSEQLRAHAWQGALRLASIAVLTLSVELAACTRIQVTNGDLVFSSYRFGVLQIAPTPNAPLLVTETSGFGLIPTTGGLSIGWTKQVLVISADPRRCQLILVVEHKEDYDIIRQQLQEARISWNRICELHM